MTARMKERGINKSQLASKLAVPPGLVTKLASGHNNFTIQTMVRIARALSCEFRCHLQPSGTKTCWIDVLNVEPLREPVVEWNPSEFRIIKFEPNALTYEPVPVAA
jgi:transcriptional regulator with XRE-family HTH domain